MAEPRTAQPFRFKGETIDQLRNELNRFAAELTEQIRTGRVITESVQFVPIRGPLKKGEAPQGTLFLRKREFDSASAGMMLQVQPNSTITESLHKFGAGTMGVDADGNTVAGGLHEE